MPSWQLLIIASEDDFFMFLPRQLLRDSEKPARLWRKWLLECSGRFTVRADGLLNATLGQLETPPRTRKMLRRRLNYYFTSYVWTCATSGEYLMRFPIRYSLILFLYETMRLLGPHWRSPSRKSSLSIAETERTSMAFKGLDAGSVAGRRLSMHKRMNCQRSLHITEGITPSRLHENLKALHYVFLIFKTSKK